MGRTNAPDSAGSQFFICQEAYAYGDGNYAAFGKVIDGIDVVDKVCSTPTDASDKPLEDIVMKSVTVDTHGITYDEPVTLPEQ